VANANIKGENSLRGIRAVAELNRSLAGDAIASYSISLGADGRITARVLPEVFHLIRISIPGKTISGRAPGCWRSANERKPFRWLLAIAFRETCFTLVCATRR